MLRGVGDHFQAPGPLQLQVQRLESLPPKGGSPPPTGRRAAAPALLPRGREKVDSGGITVPSYSADIAVLGRHASVEALVGAVRSRMSSPPAGTTAPSATGRAAPGARGQTYLELDQESCGSVESNFTT